MANGGFNVVIGGGVGIVAGVGGEAGIVFFGGGAAIAKTVDTGVIKGVVVGKAGDFGVLHHGGVEHQVLVGLFGGVTHVDAGHEMVVVVPGESEF